jgi:glutathione S-transferase
MLVLCGLPISNYYNKAKLALLEKGIAFEEELIGTAGVGAQAAEALRDSPLGKIPFIRTEHGPLCESQAILDYLEAAYPKPPLLPADPYAAAKVRELATFADLHLELVVRELYPQAFFGGNVSAETIERVRPRLVRNIAAFARLARFAPYVAGAEFSQADCSAWPHLPLVSMASRAIYGEDLLVAGGVDWKAYTRLIGERPSAQKVSADRKAWQDRAAAKT